MGEHTKQKPPLMRRSSFWIGAIILVVLIGAATVGRGTISGWLTPHTTKTVKPKPKPKPKPVKLTPYEKKSGRKVSNTSASHGSGTCGACHSNR
ncbi:hypothetical protein [Secundilactobacillus kimchicus]|uniref:hypothetical protein n=1 Tax=Secundilactobacillus kimchicus TaxID=528209 RepID=UPI0006E1C011|nr:hypothetical protein [Secundilactobacillus kimchicus]